MCVEVLNGCGFIGRKRFTRYSSPRDAPGCFRSRDGGRVNYNLSNRFDRAAPITHSLELWLLLLLVLNDFPILKRSGGCNCKFGQLPGYSCDFAPLPRPQWLNTTSSSCGAYRHA